MRGFSLAFNGMAKSSFTLNACGPGSQGKKNVKKGKIDGLI